MREMVLGHPYHGLPLREDAILQGTILVPGYATSDTRSGVVGVQSTVCRSTCSPHLSCQLSQAGLTTSVLRTYSTESDVHTDTLTHFAWQSCLGWWQVGLEPVTSGSSLKP